MTHEQVIQYINRHKYEEGYTFVEMAKRTGVSRNTIARFLNGEGISVINFFQILKGLRIEFKIDEY